MNKTVTAYAIIRLETGDAYVGSTIQRAQRWNTHRYQLRHGGHHCDHLQRAWNTYSEDAFDFMVLAQRDCETREERLAFELEWISQLGTYNVLVASDRAGQFTVSEADRVRRREAMQRRIAADPALQRRLQARGAALAELQRSPEGRANMAQHTARRWQDMDERAKLAKGLENRWSDPENHAKHAETMKALRSTPEERQRQSAALTAAWAEPNSKLRNRSNGRWADPEARARQTEKLKAAWARRKAAKPD